MIAKGTPPQVAVEDRPGCGPGLREVVWGLWIALAVVAVSEWIEPVQHEAGWLRWLRVVADHPVRCGLAAALLAFAIHPTRARRERSGSPPADGQEP